ncbi:OpgC family protein [Jiella sonneratiae]|uniref:OpgC domain-containing protein n=1 Tax=Jiella sonneratiae TaxID=2816856 RepID=A0ABS3IXW5_9HYPH|nr:OpgC domain-containing protein [Jiella sonneratiae]MBO0902252.1 OpgC domain-containing protein [Jiella sonneratiae]
MSRQRENRIDLIRGVSLLLIFVDHANVSFSEGLQQSRGFSDAAELFVMMAGMSAALAYHPATGPADLATAASRTLRRVLKLYRLHLTMILCLATAVILAPLPNHPEIVANWSLDVFAGEPGRFLLEALSLRYLPAELDILPLYVVLIASVPLWFALLDRSPWLALTVAAALWLVAGLFRINLTDLAQPRQHWYFNPFCWQLVFVIGLAAGLRLRRGETPFPYRRPLFLAAAAIAIVAIPANLLMHFGANPAEGPLRLLVTKTSEGPLRLINAIAIVYVMFNLDALARLPAEGWLRPLFAAGRNSLPVFVAGTILADLVTVCVIGSGGLSLTTELALVLCGVVLQLALAARLDRRRRKPSGAPAGSLLVASQEDQDYGSRVSPTPTPIPIPTSDAARHSTT